VAASLKQQVKNYSYTLRSSSWSALIANGMNIASGVYQWVFLALLGLKPEITYASSYLVSFFIVCFMYSKVHDLFMPLSSSLSSRWTAHDYRTASYLAVSVETLRQGAHLNFDAVAREKFIHGVLSSIHAEIERWVAESVGLYVNVSLLVEDPRDTSRLAVISRARPDRANASYPKHTLYAWRECWKKKKVFYAPDFSDPGKPYKSILLIPVKMESPNGNISVVGVISIDSSKKHHFGGLEDEIERKLLPELSLLKLALGQEAKDA
jgi:hypothetical protein